MHMFVPGWFYGLDPALHFISALIGFLLSFYFRKAYTLSTDKKHVYLHVGFLLLAISSLILGLTDAYDYLAVKKCQSLDSCTAGLIDNAYSMEVFSYFLYFGLSIAAYLLFLFAYSPEWIRSSKFFIMIFILCLFSVPLLLPASGGIITGYSYYEYFNLVAFAMLIFVSFRNAVNYIEKRTPASFFVVLSFIFIALSHLFLFFSSINDLMYVLYHVSLLIGFGSLLITIIKLKIMD